VKFLSPLSWHNGFLDATPKHDHFHTFRGTFDAQPWKAVGKFTSEMEVLIGTSSVNSGCVIEMFNYQRELVYVYIYIYICKQNTVNRGKCTAKSEAFGHF